MNRRAPVFAVFLSTIACAASDAPLTPGESEEPEAQSPAQGSDSDGAPLLEGGSFDGIVAFVAGDQVPYVLTANADGTELKELTQGSEPAWSSDGQRIAFRRGIQGEPGFIYVIGADGSDERRLVEGDEPAWSPDDEQIAYRGDGGIFTINADGSGVPRKIVGDETDLPRGEGYRPDLHNTGWVGEPSWSPDGDRIAFVRVEADSLDWWGGRLENVYIIGIDGSEPRLLTRFCKIEPPGTGSYPCHSRSPAWSGNGGEVAVVAASSVATVRVDGSDEAGGQVSRHLQPPRANGGLTWSSDGRHIVFGGEANGRRGIFVLRLKDGAVRPLFPEGSTAAEEEAMSPAWYQPRNEP